MNGQVSGYVIKQVWEMLIVESIYGHTGIQCKILSTLLYV